MLVLFVYPFGILEKLEGLGPVHLFGGLLFYRFPLHPVSFRSCDLLSKAFLVKGRFYFDAKTGGG